jgi:MFS family permease
LLLSLLLFLLLSVCSSLFASLLICSSLCFSSSPSQVFAGIVCGAFLFGFIGDRFGRRIVFLVTAAGTGVFGLVSSFSPELVSLLVFRFSCGVFLGGGPLAYTLGSEFVPTKFLWLSPFFNLWFTLGTVFEATLALVVLPTLGWRYLIGFSSAPILLLVVVFPFLKESPQWLSTRGKSEELASLLDAMYATKGRTRTARIEEGPVVEKGGNFFDLLVPSMRRRVLVFCLVWFSVNLIYYGVAFFSTSYFIQILPSDEKQALIIVLFVCAGEVFGSLGAAALVNYGMKRKFISSFFLLICCGFFFLMFSTENVYARATFSLFARGSVFAGFAVVYLWTPSVLPTHIRTSGMGLVSSFGKIASICAPFISSTFDKTNILVPVIVFGTTAFVGAVLCLLVGVEPDSDKEEKHSDDESSPLIK